MSEIAKLLEDAQKVLIVAYDAGGGNALISFSETLKANKYYLVSGPSHEILKAKGYPVDKISFRLETLDLSKFDLMISATGWETDFERNAIQKATLAGLPTVVMLDHWTDFDKRLILGGKFVAPHGILVSDDKAFQIARTTFPTVEIFQVPNYYIENIKTEYNAIKNVESKCYSRTVLYLSEPSLEPQSIGKEHRQDYMRLNQFINFMNQKAPIGIKIQFRSHPSEPSDKYFLELANSNHEIQISTDKSLTQDLVDATLCVGHQTMALHISAELGIPTFTLEELIGGNTIEFDRLLNGA